MDGFSIQVFLFKIQRMMNVVYYGLGGEGMKNRTKKEQRAIDDIMKLFVLMIGFFAWYQTGTWQGALIGVGIAFILLIIVTGIQSHQHRKKIIASGIEEIDEMTGRKFEEYLGNVFQAKGYGVKFTPTTNDYGADLLLSKQGKKIVVQAKRYKKNVGVRAVQEVIPAIQMYSASEAWVVTNSYLTNQAMKLAKVNNVKVIDRNMLMAISENYRKTTAASN